MQKISFKLEVFEGPMDLLLSLISKHKLNIYDIEISSLLEQYLASENLEIRPFLEIGNTEFIVRLLKEGQGISFLPEFTVRPDIDRGLLARVHVPAFHMNIWKQIVYHKDKWVSREMEAFFGLAAKMGGTERKS